MLRALVLIGVVSASCGAAAQERPHYSTMPTLPTLPPQSNMGGAGGPVGGSAMPPTPLPMAMPPMAMPPIPGFSVTCATYMGSCMLQSSSPMAPNGPCYCAGNGTTFAGITQ